MVHHGDEEIEQDNDVNQRKATEHDEAPEPGELLDAGQLEVVQVDQTESGPEQGLRSLPETESLFTFSDFITLNSISTNFANFL